MTSEAGKHRTRNRLLAVVLAVAVVVAGGTLVAAQLSRTTGDTPTRAGSPLRLSSGRGAQVPFVEIEAENAHHTGTLIGPGRTPGTLAAEASGRKAVRIAGTEYIEFRLTEPASSIVVRASVPDGQEGVLRVTADGIEPVELEATSRFSWFYGQFPFTNSAADGNPHHFYSETRALLGAELDAGTVVRVEPGPGADHYTVDLADFELVAPAAEQPDGSVSVLDFGADPTGTVEAADAIDQAVEAARAGSGVVWIPEGTFLVSRHIVVDQVTVRGAGPWYSVLTGDGVGVYGKYVNDDGPSRNVELHDFAIIGEVGARVDSEQVNAVGGALQDSLVSNVWLQHTKVGIWVDGPFDNLRIVDTRILDQTADGVNFHRGVTNSSVENTFVRNTGDDGLAMWADTDQNVGNSFVNNTVVAPNLANGIAIYGGENITVSGNLVADTLAEGGGIHVGNRFGAVPAAGTFVISDNTVLRGGVLDQNWEFGVGAIWFDAREAPLTAEIRVTGLNLYDSSYGAVHLIHSSITDIRLEDVSIIGAGTFALQVQTGGNASFRNVVASHLGGPAGIFSCATEQELTLEDLGGNEGWESSYCDSPAATAVRLWDSTTGAEVVEPAGEIDEGTPDLSHAPRVDETIVSTTGPQLLAAAEASSAVPGFAPEGANDAKPTTYWEGQGELPHWIEFTLDEEQVAGELLLALPPSSAWESRVQQIDVLVAGPEGELTTVVEGEDVVFDPDHDNTAVVSLGGERSISVLRIVFHTNTAWPAGQLAEVGLR